MRDFMAYAQFESFWERFQPETPFGRAAKEAMTIHHDAEKLERIWDETEVALNLIAELESDPARSSRITHHLKRIPRVPEVARSLFDEVEIFQFKKFLHNYKSLVFLVSAEVRQTFGFRYESDAVEQLLDTGRQSPESFFVADAFSTELAKIRNAIQEVDTSIQTLKKNRAEEIQAKWNLCFGERTFLVVPRETLGDVEKAAALLMLEPFDEAKISIRPLPSAEELRLLEHRAALLSAERTCEDEVLGMLSSAINRELAHLKTYREALLRFDLAFARAKLAVGHCLVRPNLHQGAIEMAGARFLPCEELCHDLGTTYVPLDARFDTSATVIFGSNMGGKTIVMKTLALLQLCAQAGLFVPASSFSTRPFRHFHYLGEGCSKGEVRGLSGFGFEIRCLTEAWKSFTEPTLVLFDEFARTTNSREAEALLSAVVESLMTNEKVTALFSTHFRGVCRLPEVRYLRMKGLDRRGLAHRQDAMMSLDARIRLIDEHMEFRLVPDVEGVQAADAIAVAELLGLATEIGNRAEHYFNRGN